MADITQEQAIQQKGYTITRRGRQLIARSLATKTPLIWTGIMIGRGIPPDDVELADVEDLFDPVAEGISTVPLYVRDRVSFTVEFRSDMVPAGMKGFYIQEFGAYAQLEGDEAPVLFVYGCQGDYPVWVGAYADGCTDIRRWPLTLVIGSGIDVGTGYSPASFMTGEDIAEYTEYILLPELLKYSGMRMMHADITIPAALWAPCDEGFQAALPINWLTADMMPLAWVLPESEIDACICGLSAFGDAEDGLLHTYAATVPKSDLRCSLLLMRPVPGQTWKPGDYEALLHPVAALQPATRSRLGGVIIGDGVDVDEEGRVSVSGDGSREATEAEILDVLNGSETD